MAHASILEGLALAQFDWLYVDTEQSAVESGSDTLALDFESQYLL